MRTYAATLTVLLQPGAARDAGHADEILRRILDAHPELLAYQYTKVNGELKTPHMLEIEAPSPSADVPPRDQRRRVSRR
jgi:hypothetical protein